MLAGGINRRVGGARMTIGRGDIDDGPAALSEHHPQLMLHAGERAEHISIECQGVAVGGLLGHRAGLTLGSRVVHSHIKPAKPFNRLIDE